MTSEPSRETPSSEIPEGMNPNARETWPSPELIISWLGDQDVDFEFRPGEDVAVHDDPEHMAAAQRFRDVLGRFASGVTVVTGTSDDEPVGMTCQSFSSVSLEPPLVLFVPSRTARAWPLIQRSGRFCVNVLGADQAEVSNTMASRGTDKFADVKWTPSPVTGAPRIEGAMAYVD
ncbi:MAG TPA: flavin reductase family protein, partial [Nocardioides sp.]|nr:flavin reductase family protein [Nocardioides sp.]